MFQWETKTMKSSWQCLVVVVKVSNRKPNAKPRCGIQFIKSGISATNAIHVKFLTCQGHDLEIQRVKDRRKPNDRPNTLSWNRVHTWRSFDWHFKRFLPFDGTEIQRVKEVGMRHSKSPLSTIVRWAQISNEWSTNATFLDSPFSGPPETRKTLQGGCSSPDKDMIWRSNKSRARSQRQVAFCRSSWEPSSQFYKLEIISSGICATNEIHVNFLTWQGPGDPTSQGQKLIEMGITVEGDLEVTMAGQDIQQVRDKL